MGRKKQKRWRYPPTFQEHVHSAHLSLVSSHHHNKRLFYPAENTVSISVVVAATAAATTSFEKKTQFLHKIKV
jgi:hypothetical protein